MRILDQLTGSQGSAVLDSMAAAFGVAPDQAKTAIGAIVPELTRAIERNTLNRGGIADLVAAMGKTDPASTLNKGANLNSAATNSQGIELLEQILGSKDKSRAVAARVASETGLQDDLIKKMLPAVAAITIAALAKGSRSPIQDVEKNMPGLRAVGPLSMPGDMAGGSTRDTGFPSGATLPPQTPLPVPGNNLPDLAPRSDTGRGPGRYDDLSDVIRRGGSRVPRTGGPSGGGTTAGAPASLDTVIRDILGGLLGFQNRGFFGWLFQALILPMIIRVVQSVLRRVFTSR